MENKSNNVLNRVLLLMNYDSSKTLTENSKVIESEFSQQLNEQKVKVKPNLNAAKNVRNATINKFKLQHQTNPKGLTPKQRNSFGQELLKNEVSVYANTKLPNGKYPNAQQQQAYADNLVKSGKIQGQIDVHAPSAAKTTATKGSQQTQNTKQNVTVNVTSPKTGGGKTKKSSSGKSKKLNGGTGPTSGTKTVPPNSTLGQKIINLAKGGMNWKSIVWTAAKWGVGIAAVWWLFFSGDDETTVVPDDIPTTPPTDTGTTSTYSKCDEALPVKQYCKNETVKKVQACLGLPEKYQTGNFGPITQKALEGKGQDGTTITTETIIAVCGSSGLPTTGGTTTGGGTATAGGTTTAGTTTAGGTGYEDYTNDEVETSTDNTSVASSPATSTPSSNTASVQQSKNSFIGPLDNDEVEQ